MTVSPFVSFSGAWFFSRAPSNLKEYFQRDMKTRLSFLMCGVKSGTVGVKLRLC